ncbi:MAG: UbiA prenyltransferase family protein [Bacteroidia bacterium]|nr:UbiA prenyltransferase family protein [Bacteroidia bacterium]MDW8235184.1 UbiA prenyltransferase family protein [Bacteroidia bacterium]
MAHILVAWIYLLRPHQYTKNTFLFVPLLFARRWDRLEEAVAGFLLWCLGASAVYAFNDARDAPSDRFHPTKKHRPVAAGIISERAAYLTALILFSGALTGAFYLSQTFGITLALYLLNNLLYTLFLKRIVLLDVFSIAIGFLLRIYGGGAIGEVPISIYLFMTVFFLSLFLALGKRRHEILLLEEDATKARHSLKGYSVYYLDQLMNISATLTLAVYSLYLTTNNFTWLLFTLPIVVLGIFRYYHLTHNRSAGEPSRDLFADKFLLGIGGLYMIIVLMEMLQIPWIQI